MRDSWRDRMPRSVVDPFDAHDQPVFTPTDRRMLWHIEFEMASCAPVGSRLARLAGDLRSYLNATCQHHWHAYEPDPDNPNDIAAHRQCMWCHDVEWLPESPEEGNEHE